MTTERPISIDARTTVAALESAIEEQRPYVVELDEDYESGYLDGLERALDVVHATAHGLQTGALRRS